MAGTIRKGVAAFLDNKNSPHQAHRRKLKICPKLGQCDTERFIPLLGEVVAAGLVVGPDGPTGRVGTVVGFLTTVKPE